MLALRRATHRASSHIAKSSGRAGTSAQGRYRILVVAATVATSQFVNSSQIERAPAGVPLHGCYELATPCARWCKVLRPRPQGGASCCHLSVVLCQGFGQRGAASATDLGDQLGTACCQPTSSPGNVLLPTSPCSCAFVCKATCSTVVLHASISRAI